MKPCYSIANGFSKFISDFWFLLHHIFPSGIPGDFCLIKGGFGPDALIMDSKRLSLNRKWRFKNKGDPI